MNPNIPTKHIVNGMRLLNMKQILLFKSYLGTCKSPTCMQMNFQKKNEIRFDKKIGELS